LATRTLKDIQAPYQPSDNMREMPNAVHAVIVWIMHYGYWALFGLLMLGIVGLPVPDETLLTFAGYLVFRHKFALLPTLAAAFFGSLCGMSLSYGLGRTLGRMAVERLGQWLHLAPARLDTVQAWYHHHGRYTLLVGYFLPGVRHLTAYVAGWSKLPLPTFMLFAAIGGLCWSSAFIVLGYGLGNEWRRWSGAVHRLVVLASMLVLVTAALVILIIRRQARSAGSRTPPSHS
jgi:membrane protein DedA with SNARE-associated domain